jgi:hypothetical protein
MQDFEEDAIENWLVGTLLPGWFGRVWSAGLPGYVEMVSPDGIAFERAALCEARFGQEANFVPAARSIMPAWPR